MDANVRQQFRSARGATARHQGINQGQEDFVGSELLGTASAQQINTLLRQPLNRLLDKGRLADAGLSRNEGNLSLPGLQEPRDAVQHLKRGIAADDLMRAWIIRCGPDRRLFPVIHQFGRAWLCRRLRGERANGRSRCLRRHDRPDETITAPRKGLDPGPSSWNQRQRAPECCDLNREIAVLNSQAVPRRCDQIFLADQLARPLDQHQQN